MLTLLMSREVTCILSIDVASTSCRSLNDILEVSKIRWAARRSIQPASIFTSLIADVEAMFDMRAEAKGLEFFAERNGDTPTCYL